TRLRPKEEEDEISSTPATRATEPSIMAVISRSMVSAAALSKRVVTEITGRSTSGNSRTSTPKSAARPATAISVLKTKARTGRRTKSAVKPLADVPMFLPVMPASGFGRRPGDVIVAGDGDGLALADRVHALHHDMITFGEGAIDQN